MQLEKINVEEIRGQYKDVRFELDGRPIITGCGDDTEKSLKVSANKINEIIDVLNEKKDGGIDYCCSDNPCQHKYYLKKDLNSHKKGEIFNHFSAIHEWIFIKTKSEKFEDYFEKIIKDDDWKNESYESVVAKKMGHLMETEYKSQRELMNESNYQNSKEYLKRNWEKEFDKEFKNLIHNEFSNPNCFSEVKQFIRNLLK